MATNARLDAPFHGCSIAPPDILIQVAEHGRTREDRDAATRTLAASASLRARRGLVRQMIRQNLASVTSLMPTSTGEQNTVYDVAGGGSQQLPGSRKRRQSDPPSDDVAVNQAWEGADETYRFYSDVLGRNSVDDRGMELVSSVHFGSDFDNAFWNGSQMVYGDGSGRIFVKGGLTAAIDVIAHELTHGVTQYTAGLEYSSQPGALNESFSDVFGSIVKQRTLGQTVDQADWLIGGGILGTAFTKNKTALRSMKAPGTANDFDRQPSDMSQYVDLPDDDDPRHDHGGVHINSGIPNHAFYRVAMTLGGNSWDRAGKIWFHALTQGLQSDADFHAAAEATVSAAAELFPESGEESDAVQQAWKEMRVL
ncbi:MAG: M4 family metallopeptidase [Actinomycetota bacterium]